MRCTMIADLLSVYAEKQQAPLPFEGVSLHIHARPVIKWAGGKWALMSALQRYLPPLGRIRHYYEPFVGGAAMFFCLQPGRASLSDTNAELINMYTVVRDQVSELIEALGQHVNAKDYFYQVRAQDPTMLAPVERAARLIYLNKTCYNGLYRVNRKGQFNVPFGNYKKPNFCDVANLEAASIALHGVRLQTADYESALCNAGQGDFVYFDPPYQPVSKTASFTSYTDTPFGPTEQAELARVMRRLTERGCYVMQSNSDTPLIRELYVDFRIETIFANRAINSKASARGPVNELVITNYVVG